MKKTTAIIGLSAVCAFLVVMLVTQVLAATYLNLNMSGSIKYNATEIGARMFALSEVAPGGGGSSINYIALSGSGVVDEDGIYNENGNAMEYANIVGQTDAEFVSSDATLSIYVFVKNKGEILS